jgi:hypothetical protein
MLGEGARRVLLLTAAASFTIAALVGVATLLGGEVGDESEDVGWSAALVTAMALIATPGVVLLDQRGRSGPWPAVGGITVVASMLVVILGLAGIWTDAVDDFDAFGVIVAVALTGSHTSLLTIGRRGDDSSGVGMLISATIAAGLTIGAIVSLAILGDADDEGVARITGALAVLDALGLVLIPITRRLQGGAGARPSSAGGASSERPGSLQQALGLDPAGSQEGSFWMLENADFEAALRRAGDLGIDSMVAGSREDAAAGRIAVLRDRGGVVVLASRRD